MAGNKYEKYLVRKAPRPIEFFDPMAKGFATQPPMIFLNGDNPIKGSNQFLEVMWIWDEGACAINPKRGPHAHKFDEIFVFLGSNREDPDDLGAEVEFWLGEKEDVEKYCSENGLEVHFTVMENGVACDANNPALKMLMEAVRQASGTEPKIAKKLAGTSARFAPEGQGVVWGQSGIGPHAKDERHHIPSIMPYYKSLNLWSELLRTESRD